MPIKYLNEDVITRLSWMKIARNGSSSSDYMEKAKFKMFGDMERFVRKRNKHVLWQKPISLESK